MERRTLIAVFLILAVLVADQFLMSRWNKSRQPAQAPGRATTAADSSLASRGDAALTGMGSPASSPSGAPAQGGPIGGATAGDQLVGTIVGGSPAISGQPRVASAPIVEHEFGNGTFTATFSSAGGSITSWVLPQYKDPLRGKAPVDLIAPGRRALQLVVSTPYFSYDFTNVPFRIAGYSESEGWITFVAEDSGGVRVSKTYRKAASPQALDVEIRVGVPAGLGPIQYRWGWGSPLPPTESHATPAEFQAVALLGAKLEAVDASKFAKQGSHALEGNVRWAGNRSKYFIATLIPDSATVGQVAFERSNGDAAVPAPSLAVSPAAQAAAAGAPTVWLVGAAPPGTEIVRHAKLYAGPTHYETLVAQGAGLDQVANLGWAWLVPLSALLLRLLNLLHDAIPNYGVAIILLSAATKLVFYPLTQSSLRSAKLMHRLQPEVNALRDRHKDDPAKMNQAMMALYKENKVNPLGGCLPMLLQVPVFMALYNILLNSIELRTAGFMGYIQDLSSPDVVMRVAGFPLHFLPIIMTGTTYLMQWQTPIDPRQKAIMNLMPIMMLVFMYSFPSGVILYWTVNNVLSALQQYLVNEAEDRKLAAGGRPVPTRRARP